MSLLTYSVVVKNYIFARPEIKLYKDGIGFKIWIQVFYIFYQKSPKIYLV